MAQGKDRLVERLGQPAVRKVDPVRVLHAEAYSTNDKTGSRWAGGLDIGCEGAIGGPSTEQKQLSWFCGERCGAMEKSWEHRVATEAVSVAEGRT